MRVKYRLAGTLARVGAEIEAADGRILGPQDSRERCNSRLTASTSSALVSK